MKNEELKETLLQITMSYQMKEEISSQLMLLKNEKNRRNEYTVWKKVKIAIFCVLVTSLIALPVKAVVQSLVNERMKHVPQKEIESIADELNSSDINADTFNRDLTGSEINRLNELFKEYQNGKFPIEKITEIESEKQINPEKICFAPATHTYYFPKREMTDEELLQYIDFRYKQSYALEQSLDEEIKAEQKEKENEEKKLVQDIQERGGVGLEEASQIGKEWMEILFQTDTEGMEKNCYLMDTSDMDTEVTNKYPEVYLSYYNTLHEYYYFYIEAGTGALVSAEQSTGEFREDLPTNLVQDNMKLNLESAKKILKKIIGAEEEFIHIYCGYGVTDEGQIDSGIVSFHFVKEDNTDYKVQITADTQELVYYSDVYYVNEEQTRAKLEELKKFIKETQNENYKGVSYYQIEVE